MVHNNFQKYRKNAWERYGAGISYYKQKNILHGEGEGPAYLSITLAQMEH
ncbi:MAG: hypothetical protein VST70_08945 [Nitrospirota bacterium]|nr:hypothetical protein [Nitrospirota bacterium]